MASPMNDFLTDAKSIALKVANRRKPTVLDARKEAEVFVRLRCNQAEEQGLGSLEPAVRVQVAGRLAHAAWTMILLWRDEREARHLENFV